MFCWHKWKWEAARYVNTYGQLDDGSPTSMPIHSHTEMSGVCVKCGEPRTERLSGHWIPPEDD